MTITYTLYKKLRVVNLGGGLYFMNIYETTCK